MAQIGLQGPRIQALFRQGVAAGVPQHMRVDLEADLGLVAGAGEQLGKARRGENGPLRSEAKTHSEADWRFSSRSARNSSPKRGCVAASPPLARCRLPVWNSIDDHCSPQSSDTRSP
jgi:hypothetical protein